MQKKGRGQQQQKRTNMKYKNTTEQLTKCQ